MTDSVTDNFKSRDASASKKFLERMVISISLPLLNFSAPLNISLISADNINQV